MMKNTQNSSLQSVRTMPKDCNVCGTPMQEVSGHLECPACGYREWSTKPHGKPVCEIICHADLRKHRCPASIQGNGHSTVPSACSVCEYGETRMFKSGERVRQLGDKRLQEIIEYKE